MILFLIKIKIFGLGHYSSTEATWFGTQIDSVKTKINSVGAFSVLVAHCMNNIQMYM